VEAPRLLSADLLEALADRWRVREAPITQNLRPGLTDDQMDSITDPLGLQLPAEARVWWGWHDGANLSSGYADDRYVGSDLEFLPLANAARHYTEGRAEFDRMGMPATFWWPANQFTVTTKSSGDITVDCAVSDGAPSPIFFVRHDRNPEVDFATPSARSFGEMVTWWIEAWDDGIWGYDKHTGQWSYEWERLDRARELTGLL